MVDPPALARDVLAVMFTPAVLISAAGQLVLSTSNRLSRVVDRVRVLAEEVAKSHTETVTSVAAKARQKLIADQMDMLFARALYLRSAVTILYMAVGLFVASIIGVGITASLKWRFGWLPVATELLGSAFLLYACSLLVREARIAVKTTLQEMEYVREVMKRSG